MKMVRILILLLSSFTTSRLYPAQNQFESLSLKELVALADSNSSDAQYELSRRYLKETNYKEAIRWQHRAADNGHANAQYGLALLYASGTIVKRDDIEAQKWFIKAADHDQFPDAQYNVGLWYYNGDGLPKNAAKAAYFFKKAAESGFPDAQNSLGVLYINGEGGLKKDPAEGIKWYLKAAYQNVKEAQYNLSAAYKNGKYVEKNDVESLSWLLVASNSNSNRVEFTHESEALAKNVGTEKSQLALKRAQAIQKEIAARK